MDRTLKNLLIFAAFVAPLGAKVLAVHTPIGEFSLFRITLVVAAVLYLRSRRFHIYLATTIHNKYSICFFLFFMLYAAFTVAWAKDMSAWMRNIFFILIAVLAVLMYSDCFRDLNALVLPLKGLFWGIMVQACIGWFEFFTRTNLYRTDVNYRSVIGNFGIPIAMQYNINNFALLMFVGACVGGICFMSSAKRRTVYLLGAINFVVLAFFSGSRAAIIAILLGIGFLLFRGRKAKLLLIVALFILFLALPQTSAYIEKVLQFNFSADQGSDYVRMNLIKNGFNFLYETFEMGVGAGQVASWMLECAQYDTQGVLAMHNYWMELLASYGIWVFAGFIVFYIKIFKDYYVTLDAKTNPMALMICTMLVGFPIAAIGPSSVLTLEWLWLFWGLCIAGQH